MFIPRVWQIALRELQVAVAVRAITCTDGGSRLLTLPRVENSCLNVSPLLNIMHIAIKGHPRYHYTFTVGIPMVKTFTVRIPTVEIPTVNTVTIGITSILTLQ